jgi:hypothetical protein
VEQPAERRLAETAAADVLVPIDTAGARLLGVVGVKRLEPADAHQTIERLERVAYPDSLVMS